MFGNKIYNVYLNESDDHPVESAVFVADGFSIMAFIFHVFWTIYHKLWFLSAIFFVLIMAIVFATQSGYLNVVESEMLRTGLTVLLGFEANEWRCSTLERRGYILYEVVFAKNESDAQLKFFNKEFNTSSAKQVAPLQTLIPQAAK